MEKRGEEDMHVDSPSKLDLALGCFHSSLRTPTELLTRVAWLIQCQPLRSAFKMDHQREVASFALLPFAGRFPPNRSTWILRGHLPFKTSKPVPDEPEARHMLAEESG